MRGYWPLVVMAIGDFIANSFRSSEVVLQYTGYPKIVSRIAFFSLGLGVALTALLIFEYGLLGAALGYVITRMMQSFMSTFWCAKILGIMPLFGAGLPFK